MEYFVNPQGSLFRLTKGEFDFIVDMIREENPLVQEKSIDTYTKDDFLEEVYMSEGRYDQLVAVLRNKKNIIMQGAPGVGKTFAAKRLAYSMMGEKDESRIEFVQFHQNYSYEDFMMGYKPVDNGFELKNGIFYRFCQKAANQPDKDYFFIIDEINRGNMSKIFGELLMLIEKDYRGVKATLAYTGLPFSVPENLYIIGMMNTADRSLAMIDYALRRRFSFFEMEPGFDSDGFIQYQKNLNNETFNELIEKVKELNTKIASDKSLGKGFCIGHSYFCGHDTCTDEWLRSIVDFDILPMLNEYWFDDTAELQRWENVLHGVFQ
jgi:5-methylcytosine-specific restriction protein B